MGAGSTIVLKSDLPKYEGKKPCKIWCMYRTIVQEIGTRHFFNTGKPYVIEECIECKWQYVREL